MIKLRQEMILNENGFHIGETIIKNESNTFQHTHDFFEVFIIEEGEVFHCINEKQVLLRKDATCLVLPEDRHYFKKGKCKKVRLVNLAFSREVFECVKESLMVFGTKFEETSGILAYLPVRLSMAILAKTALIAEGKTNLLSIPQKDIFFSILMDCLLALQSRTDTAVAAPEWLEYACREMRKEENYMQGLQHFVTISEKSQEHLTRCMKKYYNLTPAEYLNNIKLGQAALLLETTDRTVLDIMLECGFNNTSYFNKVFKKEYGVTPSHYRAVNRAVVNPI